MLEVMAGMVAEVVPYGIVEPAHMEIAEPSIQTAFERCVQRGAKLVVVSPYFLLPGRHWDQDIPGLAAEAARRHPDVPFLVAAPLGLHPLMARVVESRVAHCLAHVAGEVDECEVCAGTGRCAIAYGSAAQRVAGGHDTLGGRRTLRRRLVAPDAGQTQQPARRSPA